MWLLVGLSVSIITAIALFSVWVMFPLIKRYTHAVEWFVAFAAGALLGDVFFHILPEMAEDGGGATMPILGAFLLLGILTSFVIERYIHFRHCHDGDCETHVEKKSMLTMMLVGDSIHNFVDGLAIGVSYLVSIPVGIATTFAVAFHEIPQELGDTAILAHNGKTLKRALMANGITACTAFLGAGAGLVAGNMFGHITPYLSAVVAGNFIYIATADIIPHLHKSDHKHSIFFQPVAIALGACAMWALLLVG